jgi:hypothetical protein
MKEELVFTFHKVNISENVEAAMAVCCSFDPYELLEALTYS